MLVDRWDGCVYRTYVCRLGLLGDRCGDLRARTVDGGCTCIRRENRFLRVRVSVDAWIDGRVFEFLAAY